MDRKAFAYLMDWKQRAKRKPLVVRGARQVGKSYLVEAFARAEFAVQLTVNADRDREFLRRIIHEPPSRMLQLLELEYDRRLVPGEVLIFFDEIQAVPELLARLRYFYEELPALHVIAAGSLLDFVLEEHSFSMPVGRIEYLHLGPLSFGEFLDATGNARWSGFLAAFGCGESMPEAAHQTLMRLFRTFLALGGMPEAVETYARTRSLLEADRIKESILGTLRDDFAKYGRRVNHDRLLRVFGRLPALAGQRFKFVNISREDSAREIGHCLHLLELARLVYRVRQSSCSGLPLGAQVREDSFKMLFLDCGLLLRACGLGAAGVEREPDLMLVNAGAAVEQVVGQHLLHARPFWETPELFYWAREKPTSSAEVDYVITCSGQIVPVEVKAGKTGRLRSLWQFMAEKKSRLALRFNADKPSLLDTSDTMHDGTKLAYRLLSLPLYLIEHAYRLSDEAIARMAEGAGAGPGGGT
jgi:predicted AAA+ superfamily ATPase